MEDYTTTPKPKQVITVYFSDGTVFVTVTKNTIKTDADWLEYVNGRSDCGALHDYAYHKTKYLGFDIEIVRSELSNNEAKNVKADTVVKHRKNKLFVMNNICKREKLEAQAIEIAHLKRIIHGLQLEIERIT